MGTELHYTHNLFTTLLKNCHDRVTTIFNSQDSRVNCNNRLLKVGIWTSLDWLQESMDRLLEQYSRESIRNTMLNHEEIFKQQVHELHRLYRVQKMLLAELRSREVKLHSLTTAATPTVVTDSRARFWSSTSTSETSHSSHVSNRHHSTALLNSEYSSVHRCSTMARPSSWELSVCSDDPLRKQKGFDLELPAEEDTDIGVGGNQDQAALLRKHLKGTINKEGPDLWTDGQSNVELTLSIGCGSDQRKPKHWLDSSIGLGCSKPTPSESRQLILSTPVRPERGEECSDPSAGFDSESLQRPRWPFQALSLNRT